MKRLLRIIIIIMLIGNEILPSFLYAGEGEEITEIHESTESTSELASEPSESKPSSEEPEKTEEIQEPETTDPTQEITESVPETTEEISQEEFQKYRILKEYYPEIFIDFCLGSLSIRGF